MMGSFGIYPFIRLIFPFAGGIVAGISSGIGFSALPAAAFIGSLGAYAIIVLSLPRINYSYRWLPGLMINLSLLLAGWTYVSIRLQHGEEIVSENPSRGFYVARIIEPPVEKTNSHMTILEAYPAESQSPARKVLAYLSRDSSATGLQYGDIILFSGIISGIEAPLNPGQFDYKNFMALKGIRFQTYLSGNDYKKLYSPSWKGLKGLSLQIRSDIKRRTEHLIKDPENAAIAIAMLLGDDQLLSREQQTSFSSAGATHVLCVSGLHVGIVYLLLGALLGRLKARKWTNVLRVTLLITGIWSYALITGMSPSVMRAATMLTFIISGQILRQKPNIYNSIGASAFFLMLINPCIIMGVGFQLSYLAVLGIVSIQPMMYNLLYSRYWLPDKVWALITVSLAAQIGTAPLAIHYFNQFPVYFLLTNIIVVPLSSLILYSGFSTLMLANIAWLKYPLVFSFNSVLFCMNKAVSIIAKTEGSTVSGITMNSMQCLAVYALLLSSIFWLSTRNKTCRMISLLLIPVTLLLFTIERKERLNKDQITVYAIRGHTAIGFNAGMEHALIADTALIRETKLISFNLQGNWVKSGLKTPHFIGLDQDTVLFMKNYFLKKKDDFIFFNGIRLAVLSDFPVPERSFPEQDLLIIEGISYIDTMKTCIRELSCPVILNGSLWENEKTILRKVIKQNHQEIWDISEEGAYIMKLKK